MFFASMVVGWNGIGNGDPEHLWHLRDHNGALCGLGSMTKRPHLWHPFAHDDPTDTEMHPSVGVCVDECPDAGDWVCVEDAAQEASKKAGGGGGGRRRRRGLLEGNAVDGEGVGVVRGVRRALREAERVKVNPIESEEFDFVVERTDTPAFNAPPIHHRRLLANETQAKPNATACPGGTWTAAYLDYDETFNACVPAEDQTNSTHSPDAMARAIDEAHAVVDTPERTFSNLLADIYIARWCILIAVILTTLISYGMLMALENGAAAFTNLAFVSAIILQGCIALALGGQAIGQDTPVVGDAVITNVDTRVGAADVIMTWILPIIGACFAASAGAMAWYVFSHFRMLPYGQFD
jgi:hypothetical protein